MTPAQLAAVWIGTGVAAAVVGRWWRRAVWSLPLLPTAATLGVIPASSWPGPAAAAGYGASLVLGRPGAGLLLLAGTSVATAFLLAPRLDGGEVLTTAVVAAASVVVLSATVPAVWSVAVAVAIGALALRWVAQTPGRPTLNGGRVACLGAAGLVAAAPFLAAPGPSGDPRGLLAGGLLGGGLATLLGLLPVGGWAVATVTRVRGADVAPWALLVAPALLLTALPLFAHLPPRTRTPAADTLLVLGLASGLYGGMRAALTGPAGRYRRVFLADLALGAAAVAGGHGGGHAGMLVLLVGHLLVAPLLLHRPRRGTTGAARVAWLTLSGLPPMPSFWGRLLVAQGLAPTSSLALGLALLAFVPLLVASLRGAIGPLGPVEGPTAGRSRAVVAWGVAVAAVALGAAPGGIAGRIFGIDLGTV